MGARRMSIFMDRSLVPSTAATSRVRSPPRNAGPPLRADLPIDPRRRGYCSHDGRSRYKRPRHTVDRSQRSRRRARRSTAAWHTNDRGPTSGGGSALWVAPRWLWARRSIVRARPPACLHTPSTSLIGRPARKVTQACRIWVFVTPRPSSVVSRPSGHTVRCTQPATYSRPMI